MKKDFKELVRVFYGDHELFGYLEATDEIELLIIRVQDEDLIKEFENQKEKKFTFHCKKLSGNFISLLNCFLSSTRDGKADELEFVFSPMLYIDNSYEVHANSIEDVKFTSLTGSYFNFHPLFTGLKENEKISGVFGYKDNEIIFKLEMVTDKSLNRFEEVKRSKVLVTFRSQKAKDFYYFRDLFFRFTTMISFLSNTFIPNEYFAYNNKGSLSKGSAKVYYRGDKSQGSLKKPKIHGYTHKLKANRKEIQNYIIEPMTDKNFKLFMYFVSTFRFENQLLEDKFLNYYRSLESLAFDKNDSNKKYSSDYMKSLLENLNEVLNTDIFNEDDIAHIKSSTRGNNAKPGGEVINDLIVNYLNINSLVIGEEQESLDKFIKHLKSLRDKLSHGRNYDIKDKDRKRINKLRELVRELLAIELGISNPLFTQDHEYEFEEIDVPKAMKSVEEFEKQEEGFEKELGSSMSFEEEKRQIEKSIEDKQDPNADSNSNT